MKVYRKNRTQYAQLLIYNVKGQLAFLIGDNGTAKIYQRFNGEIIKKFHSKAAEEKAGDEADWERKFTSVGYEEYNKRTGKFYITPGKFK